MAKRTLLLLLFALVVESRLVKSPDGKSVHPHFRGPPTFNPPPPPFNNFSKPSGRSSNVYPSWTRLDCDGDYGAGEKSPTGAQINNPLIMLINNDNFYFFYEDFVISMAPPELRKAFTNSKVELTDRDVELLTTRPVYAYHTKSRVAFLDQVELSVHLAIFFQRVIAMII